MEKRSPNILLALDWFDPRIYGGIAKFAMKAGWHLSPYFYSNRTRMDNWVGDGMITCCEPETASSYRTNGVPTVDISFVPLDIEVPRVLPNNGEMAQLAAEHFLKRGYQHLAYFSWPEIPVNEDRRVKFEQAAKTLGLADDCFHLIRQPSDRKLRDWKKQKEDIQGQLEKLPRPLGVFAGQDNLGANLIDVCVRSGIQVPDEVAILGVDNEEYLCESLAVPLSSIDSRLEELGYEAACQLQRLLEGEIGNDEPPLLVSPGRVVRRRSSEALAVQHAGVAQALQLMRSDFSKGLTLEELCEQVKISKRGLEKAFRRHLQRSPAAELRQIRLDHAKRMLVQTDEKIEVVAHQSGYSNSSNLSLAFRKDTQMSPREYRQRFRR